MDWILENISKMEAIIVAIVALILAVIAAYKQIRQAWEQRNVTALYDAAIPLITQAETKPLDLLNGLVNKPNVNVLTNEGKRNVVAQALIEREPKLLKKLKLTDVLSIGNFISGVYQSVKPVIKGLKK